MQTGVVAGGHRFANDKAMVGGRISDRVGLASAGLPEPAGGRTGLAEKDTSLSAAHCAVKGLLAEGDRRVYYVPTDAGYDWIKVDGAAGGGCFGSDEAARQAGWQRPR